MKPCTLENERIINSSFSGLHLASQKAGAGLLIPSLIDYSPIRRSVTMSISLDSPQYIILKEKAAMGERLQKSLKTGEHSDIVVTLNFSNHDGTTETKTYKLHKNIVSAHSGYFKALFADGNSFKESKTNTVELKDQEREVFEKVIEYMYTGSFEEVDDIVLNSKIYVAADYFVMPALKGICLLRVAWNIEIKFDGSPPFILSDTRRYELIQGLDIIFSVGQELNDDAYELSRNLARRSFELKDMEEFQNLLVKHGKIGFLIFRAFSELSIGKTADMDEVPIELYCSRCLVLTESRWGCFSSNKCLREEDGFHGWRKGYNTYCHKCNRTLELLCQGCKMAKFPYA